MDVNKRLNLLPLLFLPALTFLVYANSLHGAFVFDDQQLIFQNVKTMNTRTLGMSPRSARIFENCYWSPIG